MYRIINSCLMTLLFCVLVPLVSLAGEADEKDAGNKDVVLHFDQAQQALGELQFNQKEELKPVPNDLKLIEASFMSNNVGERWAIVTIENSSSGRRLFRNENIVATFANGKQSKAIDLNESIEGGARLTKAIFFGFHKFPIVRVETEK